MDSPSSVKMSRTASIRKKLFLGECFSSFKELDWKIDLNQRITRRMSQVHISQQHPSLRQSINEYNRLSSELRQCNNVDVFKSKLKVKLMNESDEFVAISPFYFINWACDTQLWYLQEFLNFRCVTDILLLLFLFLF